MSRVDEYNTDESDEEDDELESEEEESEEEDEEEETDDDDDDDDNGYATGAMVVRDDSEEDDDDDDEEESDDDDEEEGAETALVLHEETIVTETFTDETEEKDDRNRCLPWLCCLLCCCCLCLLLAIGLFLGLWLFKKDDETSMPPTITAFPSVAVTSSPTTLTPTGEITPAPTTLPPTAGPTYILPPLIELPPVADTYLRSGPASGENFGTSEELLIEGGGTEQSNILLSFDLSELEHYLVNGETIPAVLLRLVQRQPSESSGPMTVAISKVPSGDDLDVESLTYDSFTPVGTVAGPQKEVAPTDTTVEVDITQLVVSLNNPGVDGNRRLHGRGQLRSRTLQGNKPVQWQKVDKRLVLLVQATAGAPAATSFHSREFSSSAFTPQLIVKFNTQPPTMAPTGTPQPTTTPFPTSHPTASPAPSKSPAPSSTPTRTQQPTIKPSVSPTSSQAPTDCYSQAQPKLLNMYGTGNPIEASEVIETIAQKVTSVKFSIRQLWTPEGQSADWIIPYWQLYDGKNGTHCERVFNVPYGDRTIYEAPCRPFPAEDAAYIAIMVNDDSFIQGTDTALPEGCVADPTDLEGKKSTYFVQIPCNPAGGCDYSSAPTPTP